MGRTAVRAGPPVGAPRVAEEAAVFLIVERPPAHRVERRHRDVAMPRRASLPAKLQREPDRGGVRKLRRAAEAAVPGIEGRGNAVDQLRGSCNRRRTANTDVTGTDENRGRARRACARSEKRWT